MRMRCRERGSYVSSSVRPARMRGVAMTLYVYAARPKATYGTKYGDNAVACVRRKYPKHEVLDPAKLFESHADWEQRWSGIADSLDDFVLIPNPDGTIGQGCFEEYEAVRGLGIPACLFINEREFVEKFYVRRLDGGLSKIRFARVVARS